MDEETKKARIKATFALYRKFVEAGSEYLKSDPDASVLTVVCAVLTMYKVTMKAAQVLYGPGVVEAIMESLMIIPHQEVSEVLQDQEKLKNWIDAQFTEVSDATQREGEGKTFPIEEPREPLPGSVREDEAQQNETHPSEQRSEGPGTVEDGPNSDPTN